MLLINDFVIKEEVCNMQCKYCLTGTSLFKKKELYKKNEKCLIYASGTQLYSNIDEITNAIYENFKPAILKISGGEVLLIKGIVNFIKKHSVNYKRIQLLTNGVLLTQRITEELSSISNLCLQISLDHHTMEGNFYRTPNRELLSKILSNLNYAVSLGINTEINCVLSDKNTHIIQSFVQFLLRYRDYVMLLPFPVRGRMKSNYMPKDEQLKGVYALIKEYDVYCDVLPPKKYLESLYEFLCTGRRSNKCNFPRMALGSFDDGNITPCANYWFSTFGSVLNERHIVLDRIGKDKIYSVLCNSKHLLSECEQCFTPWEIVNLYVEGLISLDELKRVPLYSFEGVEKYLEDLTGEKI